MTMEGSIFKNSRRRLPPLRSIIVGLDFDFISDDIQMEATVTSDMAASTMSLKLLIDPKVQRVLYAEAGKDFVDFLLGMLMLPVGSIIDLSQKHALESSLAKLYDSIKNLNESFMQPKKSKTTLLKPSCPSVPLLGLKDAKDDQKNPHKCNCNYRMHPSYDQRSTCPYCHGSIAPPVSPGYVKGVTYMVADNLAFTPFSTNSCFTLLRKFDINDTSLLEERVVEFGKNEAVKLVGAAFQSKMVLTDVFLLSGQLVKVEKS